MSYKDKTKVVKEGGTGVQSQTAYGVVAGGTTTTASTQNAGAGTSGQFLTSGGAGALPAWVEQPTIWENLASDPSSPSNGDVWFNTTSNTFKGAGVASLGWTTKAVYPLANNGMPLGAGNPEDALGGSGTSPYTQTYRYSLSGDSWTSKTAMNNGHRNGGMTGADGSDVLMCGGGVYIADVERYDGSGDSWTNKTSMITARNQFGITGGVTTAFAIAGRTTGNINIKLTELYDGGGDSWSAKADYPITTNQIGAAGASGGDAVGFGTATPGTNSYLWDSSGDSWSTTGSLNTAVRRPGNTGTTSDAFCIGGTTTGATKICQRYQSATWSTIASLSVEASNMGSTNFSSGSYLALKWSGAKLAGSTNATELLSGGTSIFTFTTS